VCRRAVTLLLPWTLKRPQQLGRWAHVLTTDTATVLFACAGFVSAGLFRSVRGPKAAVIAGAVGSLAAAGLAGARQYFPSL
jgi:hypothetical protein